MNNDDSNDSILSNKYFNDNFDDNFNDEENIRLSERRNAVKPYIPPPKKEYNNEVEIKQPKKTFFCCKFFCK